MDRRRLLELGAAGAALAGTGAAGGFVLLPPGPSRVLLPVDELAARFVASLGPELRAAICVDHDHPYRQFHNRGVAGGGARVFFSGLDRTQRRLLTDLVHAGLSPAGRERIPREFFVRWPGVHLMNVLVCGDPRTPPYQIVLTGPHLNLRLGGASPEGVAFGGPQVYGDQRGDGTPGLPGNLYRYQFRAAQRLFESLSPEARRAAVLPVSPIQTDLVLRGRAGAFPGVPIGELDDASRRLAGALVEDVLGTWRAEDVAYARECLAANGGVDALSVSWYEDGDPAGRGEYQVFRLEGPAAVLHFRGHPHVHAFVHVAMDGDAPLGVGEALAENPTPLEGEAVKRLFEEAMRAGTGADLGFYELGAVAGRLRAGMIRTGDVYTLESWEDALEVVEVRGADLAAPLAAALRAAGREPDAERRYRIATTGYVAGGSTIGRVESRAARGLVRDALIAHLRGGGLSDAAG